MPFSDNVSTTDIAVVRTTYVLAPTSDPIWNWEVASKDLIAFRISIGHEMGEYCLISLIDRGVPFTVDKLLCVCYLSCFNILKLNGAEQKARTDYVKESGRRNMMARIKNNMDVIVMYIAGGLLGIVGE